MLNMSLIFSMLSIFQLYLDPRIMIPFLFIFHVLCAASVDG